MLVDHLRDHIQKFGFITVADYMSLCLLHPQYGYYTTSEPFGSQGDFVTAPEVSQLFGEIVGIWAATTWSENGEPSDFNLIELGPGHGTLMHDLLRAVNHIEGFNDNVHVHLVEASPRLQRVQQQKLNAPADKVTWHTLIDSIPFDKPSLLIANEFFDALPISQYVVVDKKWQERVIVLDGDQFAWSYNMSKKDMDHLPDSSDLPDGTIYEGFDQSNAIFSRLCAGIKQSSGAMAIIDYGDYIAPRLGDTLQAIKDHGFVNVLEHQGQADLTAHVDFQTFEQIARGHALKTAFMTQKEFLQFYGIDIRLRVLAKKASLAEKETLLSGYERLVGDSQMGRLFKVLLVQS